MSGDEDHAVEPRWGLVGNIVEERLVGASGERRSGTKMFRPGAKVHYHSAHWGMGAEQITVIGQHRGSRKFVTTVIDHRHVTNWRAKMIYQPAVLKRLGEIQIDRRFPATEADAHELVIRLQRHRDDAMRAIDRLPEDIDDLIDSWSHADDPDLRWVREFDGDRGMVLMQDDAIVGLRYSPSWASRQRTEVVRCGSVMIYPMDIVAMGYRFW